jgi:hypothetical protein
LELAVKIEGRKEIGTIGAAGWTNTLTLHAEKVESSYWQFSSAYERDLEEKLAHGNNGQGQKDGGYRSIFRS